MGSNFMTGMPSTTFPCPWSQGGNPCPNGGTSMDLDFVASPGKIAFTVPYLHYWSMIVIEDQ